jgi:hypothetical protein
VSLVGQFPGQVQIAGIPIDPDCRAGMSREVDGELAMPTADVEHDVIRPGEFVDHVREEGFAVPISDTRHPGVREAALGDAGIVHGISYVYIGQTEKALRGHGIHSIVV